MTLCGWLLPSVGETSRLPVSAGWRLTFSSSCSSCRDPNESRLRQKVGTLWFPSFRKAKTADGSNQRFEAQRREATIMTTEIISKSDMISPPSTFVFRGEKPSAICFLPAGSPKASPPLYHKQCISVKLCFMTRTIFVPNSI